MAKEATSLAETRSHNVPPAVFLKHYRDIRRLKDDRDDAAMALARAKKAAKNEGIDLDALKMLEKLSALDLDEAELQLKNLRMYAAWIELPLGSQLDMFGKAEPATVDAKTAAEQREWQAGEEGAHAGKAGHERDVNPWSAGTAEYVAWDRAWAAGNKTWLKSQQQIASEMEIPAIPEAGNGATPPPPKRGRAAKEQQAAIL
jgi:hypothetical protein